MKATFNHMNFNVLDLTRSLAFYDEALGLAPVRRHSAPDGSFEIVFLADGQGSPFSLELTWLRDHPQPYDLGEQEFHLAFAVEDLEAARQFHRQKGWICYENLSMGIYFLEDPDGYWIEIIPRR